MWLRRGRDQSKKQRRRENTRIEGGEGQRKKEIDIYCSSKRPIKTRYLGHVTGYQPIRDQYFYCSRFVGLRSLVESITTTHNSQNIICNRSILRKNHKSDFSTKPSVRLINPAKTDIGKKMLDRIIKELRSSQCTGDNKLIQWRNTAEVLEWFKTAGKRKAIFLQFDIEAYYPSITEELPKRALNWAKTITKIPVTEEETIIFAKKFLLYNQGETMGSWDGAENSDHVGLYLLHQIRSQSVLPAGSLGLYRDDGLAIIEEQTGPKIENIKKKLIKLCKQEGLKITVSIPSKETDFLDVTLNLTSGTHKPYVKKDNTILYVDKRSDHPVSIKKNLPKMIEKRISVLSSDREKFMEAKGPYEEALKRSNFEGSCCQGISLSLLDIVLRPPLDG
eukprot:sb/3465512/